MPHENVRIMCPNLVCRRILAVPPTARGKIVRCRNCGANIRVPLPSTPKVPDAGETTAKAGTPAPPQAEAKK